MSHTDVYATLFTQHAQKTHHLVVVIQRLAHTHQNDGGHTHAGVLLSGLNLTNHLRRRQIADKTAHAGSAEGTAHLAAHLGGQTLAPSVLILHQHRLHRFTIVQLKQVFHGSIDGRNQFAQYLHAGNRINFRHLLPQILGQVGHLVKVGDSSIQPFANLFGSERGIAIGF